MVGVHGRQPVPLQLVGHDRDELLHARLVVGPVADDLLAVGQVAVGVREVRLQAQRGPVRLDRLRDVAGVLRNREMAVSGAGTQIVSIVNTDRRFVCMSPDRSRNFKRMRNECQ